jgi:hypothetical protein
MNKKATYTGNVVEEMPKIVVLIIIIIFLVNLINILTMNKLDTKEIEAALLVDRMIYSRNCFSYSDSQLGRPYPGIIDYDKFKSEILDKCIYYGVEQKQKIENVYTSAKVTLTDLESQEESIIYHNKKWYEYWTPLLSQKSLAGGQGSTLSFKEKNFVLIKKGDRLTKGKLEFDVILPNV